MAMSEGVRTGSIVIGCSLLVLTFISVICGSVAMSVMTRPANVSVGLWGLYFIIPGVFSILAGYKKQSSSLVVALATHILGTIIAIVGLFLGAVLWAILASTCGDTYNGHCSCLYVDQLKTYPANCSDLKTVRECTGAVTIIFALYAVITFVGSIYGCIGTCCAPREHAGVVVTTVQHPNTVVMTTQGYPAAYPTAYPAAYPTAYPGYSQQPPAYDQAAGQVQMPVVDNKA